MRGLGVSADPEAILTANAPDLLKYFERRERNDAPDLLAETLLVAWRRAEDLPADPIEARMWLFVIARTVLLGHGRDSSRRSRLADRLRERTRLESTRDSDLALDVRSAIAELPAADAELIRLVHWEGMTLAGASQVLGLNSSTARGRYQRARETLAARLGHSVGQKAQA